MPSRSPPSDKPARKGAAPPRRKKASGRKRPSPKPATAKRSSRPPKSAGKKAASGKPTRARPSGNKGKQKAPAAKAPAARKTTKQSPKAVAVGKARLPRPVGRARRLLLLLFGLALAVLALDVALLWESVTERMEGRTHDEPARIVGLVPRLAPGLPATQEGWRSTWTELGYSEVRSGEALRPGQFSMQRRTWTVHPTDGPALKVSVRGRRIHELRRQDDGARLGAWDFPLPTISLMTDSSRERRSVAPLSAIPLSLQRAVVAIEDERFHRHHGIDPRGVARAAVRNLQAGGVSQGGSTLSQQLAKNMFLTSDRTFRRKGQEALLALILEHRYDKDRLLEAYLNEIYLGQRDGYAIMGVGEASRVWFGKEVGNLDVAESALLAGAIRAPNRTVPWRHPETALERRNTVLNSMERLAALPTEAILEARQQPVTWSESVSLHRRAPWFLDALSEELGDRYSPEALHRDGLELVSTLDSRMQVAAERAVEKQIETLRASRPELWAEGAGPQVALVALEPRTGAIRALVGGVDYNSSQFNRVTSARRQPGSAFKPIVLAAAIGDRWPELGPASIVDDMEISIAGAGPGGSAWTPRNHDDRVLGPISLRQATEESRNLPFVHLGLEIGAGRIQSAAEAMGIRSSLSPVPSLSIGSQEVSPLELASAYATLANGGLHNPPILLDGVRARDGSWLERAMPRSIAAIDPRVAAVVTDLLQGVVDEGTARAVRRAGITIPLAGKTGTSNDARDAWMVGYTPELVVAVWMGFDEGRPLGLSSTQAAVPLWIEFFEQIEPLLAGADFERPRGSYEAGRGGHGRKRLRSDRQLQRELEREDRSRRRMEEAAQRAMDR